jgi:hypothetical protein
MPKYHLRPSTIATAALSALAGGGLAMAGPLAKAGVGGSAPHPTVVELFKSQGVLHA